jgi:hypothetical protein
MTGIADFFLFCFYNYFVKTNFENILCQNVNFAVLERN